MADQPEVLLHLDVERGIVLVSGRAVPADEVFRVLNDLPITNLRADSVRWGLACHVDLFDQSARARLSFVGRRGRLEIPIPPLHKFVCDHVATEGRWFPLDEEAARAAADASARGDDNGSVSAATALELCSLMRAAGIDVSISSLGGDGSSCTKAQSWVNNFTRETRLFPYQQSGVEWLQARFQAGMGALLADEMGLGKTLQAIAWIVAEVKQEGRVLIVTPASLSENWRRELIKFGNLQPFLYFGPGLATPPSVLRQQAVVLTTYDSVRQHQLVLEQIDWTSVVADEAQYIKNPSSGRSLAVKALPRKRALAITGTPLENRLAEVVSVLDLVAPRVFGPLTRENEQQLEGAWETKVRPFLPSFMLRREVKDVRRDLPPKILVPVPLVPSARYTAEQERLVSQAHDASFGERLALITQLRRLSGSEVVDSSGKGEFLDEVMSNLGTSAGKALIFAAFSESIDALRAHIRSRGLACWTITGATPPSDRQGIIDEFTACPSEAVLVLNPKAGGVGLNITAASVVVHWEPEWNPAITDQATARAHRTGQEQTVFVYNLFYVGGIEEYMVTKQDEKRQLAADAVQPTESPLSASEIDKMFDWIEGGSLG